MEYYFILRMHLDLALPLVVTQMDVQAPQNGNTPFLVFWLKFCACKGYRISVIFQFC